MEKTLKVVLLTNNYTPYSGGVVSSINVLVDGLQQKGHDVRIVAPDFLGTQKDDPDHVYRLPCPVRFKYKKNHMAVPWRTTYHVCKYLKKVKADLVHVHHPFLLGVAGLKAAQKLQLPVIFTYHTIYEAYHHYVPFFPDLTKVAIKKLVSSFCKQVDHIIAPSSLIQKSIQSEQTTTPVTVIPSAIKDCFIAQGCPRKQRGKKIMLLSVGRFAQEKNLPFLLEVLARLDNRFQLTLVGYGSEQNYLQWYAYTKLQLSQEQVSFVVRPPQDHLVHFYQQADLFLFSSRTDTQGLVLAEAMASGTPVIALDGPGQQDIIQQGYNGYIVDSKEQMEDVITMVLEDVSLYSKLSSGAYQTGKQYAQDVFITKMVNQYQSLMGD